jgi:Cu/Zn superoxide dismutase
MSNLRAKAVLIGDEIHVAGNKDQWGRGTQTSSTTADSSKKPVYGIIEFEQQGDTVIITGQIAGLGENTQHGFHVHEFGDVSNVSFNVCRVYYLLKNIAFSGMSIRWSSFQST